MKQRVKTVSYLAKAEFDIKNGTYDLVALPSGAEVVKCDLEVVGEVSAAKASVGFKTTQAEIPNIFSVWDECFSSARNYIKTL